MNYSCEIILARLIIVSCFLEIAILLSSIGLALAEEDKQKIFFLVMILSNLTFFAVTLLISVVEYRRKTC